MTRKLLLLTCASSALGLSYGAANADTAQASDTNQNAASVSEIVVVAEHRETALQKIPVAVSVFTGNQRDLVGINSVEDVTNFAPGFSYDPVTVHAYIRGVGRQSINITDQNRVATYEDEFYVYSPYGLDKSSLFLAQSQIERGPQNVGGMNAEGGSMDEVSVRPTDQPYAEIRATVGNFDHSKIEAAASGPIAPGLNVRLAGYVDNQDGYYTNLAGGPAEGGAIKEWYLEGQADWKPNDKFELWTRAYLEGWNNRGDAGSRAGFADNPWDETNLTDGNVNVGMGLFVNPNYGYAAPGGNPAARAALLAAEAKGDPDIAPTSVTLAAPGILNNPSLSNPNNFSSPGSRNVKLSNFDDFNYILTYHFDGFDFKYTGGVQGYDYDLNYPYVDTDVTSFTLPGSNPATVATFNDIFAAFTGGLASGPFPGCAAGSALCGGKGALPAAGVLPAAGPLVINPTTNLSYIEDDVWTAHDFVLESTNDSPFQWEIGGFYYFQHYNQPIELSDRNQPQLTDPYSVLPAPIADPIAVSAANPTGFVGFTPGTLDPFGNPRADIFYNDYTFNVTSVAGYGQFSYKFNDQFKFTGNFRYTWDSKQGQEIDRDVAFSSGLIDGYSTFFGNKTPALDDTTGLICPTGNNSTATSCATGSLARGVKSAATEITTGQFAGYWKRQLGGTSAAPTGGAGIEWTPTSDIFTYARYSRGYEALSFTAGPIAANPEVSPEYINSYEIGYKQNFGRNLSIDVAAFYYDYEGLQLPISVLVGGITEGAFINVPQSRVDGVEFEGVWSPIKDLVFTGSYSYNDSAIMTSCKGTVNGGVFVASSNALCLLDTQDPDAVAPGARPFPGQAAGAARVQSVSGDELPQAPRNKLAISASYTWRFEPGDFTLEGSYAWRDRQDATVFERSYYDTPTWDDVDLRAMWKGPKDRYEVIGFVRNVFNNLEYDVPAAGVGLAGTTNSLANAATGLVQSNIYELAPPRTFGMEVRYKFF